MVGVSLHCHAATPKVLREELAMMRTAFELKIELLKQEVLPECVCRGVRLRVSGC